MTIEATNATERLTMNIDGQFLVFSVIDVDAATAERILSGNLANRKVKENHLKGLSTDWALNNYKFNGAPILIAEDGTLLDGQHRLLAVIRSGVTVPMLVIRGFRNETQTTVDTGVKRNVADILQLRGEKNSTSLASITRLAMAWTYNGPARLLDKTFTTNQCIDFIDQNPDLRLAASKCKTIADRYHLSRSFTAFAWWVLNRISPEDNAEFWSLLLGSPQPPHPVAALQSALLKDLANRRSGRRRLPVHQLAMLFKTWNLYMTGGTCALMTFKVGGAKPERFPEPIGPVT